MAFNLRDTLTTNTTPPPRGVVSPPPPVAKVDFNKELDPLRDKYFPLPFSGGVKRRHQSLPPLGEALGVKPTDYGADGQPLSPGAWAADWAARNRREAFSGGATEDESKLAEAFRTANPAFNEKMNDRELVHYLYNNHPNLVAYKDHSGVSDDMRLKVLSNLYAVPPSAEKAPEPERPLLERVARGVVGGVTEILGGIADRTAGLAASEIYKASANDHLSDAKMYREKYEQLRAAGKPIEDPEVQSVLGLLEKSFSTLRDLRAASDFANNAGTIEAIGFIGPEEVKVGAQAGGRLLRELPFSGTVRKIGQWAETIAAKKGVAPWIVRNIVFPALHGGAQMGTIEAGRAIAFGDTKDQAATRIAQGFASGIIVSPVFHVGGGVIRRVVAAGGPAARLESQIANELDNLAVSFKDTPIDPNLPTHREAARIVEERIPGASQTKSGQELIRRLTTQFDAVTLTPEQLALKRTFVAQTLPTILDEFKPDATKPVTEEAERIVKAYLEKTAKLAGVAEKDIPAYVDAEYKNNDYIALVEDKIKALHPPAVHPAGTPAVPPTPDAPTRPKVFNASTPDADLPKDITDPNTRLKIPIRASGNRKGADLRLLIRTYKNTIEEHDPGLKEALWREIHAAYNNGKYPSADFEGKMPKDLEPPSWRRKGVAPAAPAADVPTTPAPGESQTVVNGQPVTVQDAFNPDVTMDGRFHPVSMDTPDHVVRPYTFRDYITDVISDGLDKIVNGAPEGESLTFSDLRFNLRNMLAEAGFHMDDLNAIANADGTVRYSTLDNYVDDFIKSVIDHKLYEDPSFGRSFNPRNADDLSLRHGENDVLSGLIVMRRNSGASAASPDFEALAKKESERLASLEQAATPESAEGVPTEDAWTRYARQQREQRDLETREAQRLAQVEAVANAEQAARAAEERWVWETAQNRAQRAELERASRPARIAEQKKLRDLARAHQQSLRYAEMAQSTPAPASFSAPATPMSPEDAALRRVYGGAFTNPETMTDAHLTSLGLWRNPVGGKIEVSPLLTAQRAARELQAAQMRGALAALGESARTSAGKPVANTVVVNSTKVHVKLNAAGDALAVGAKGARVKDDVLAEVIKRAHTAGAPVEITLTPSNVKGQPVAFDATRLAELKARGFYVRQVSPTEMVLRIDPIKAGSGEVTPVQALQITNGDVSGAKTYTGLDPSDAIALAGNSEPGSPLVP